jgi:hemolysin-activating ACP:hemolysin acyltransferase
MFFRSKTEPVAPAPVAPVAEPFPSAAPAAAPAFADPTAAAAPLAAPAFGSPPMTSATPEATDEQKRRAAAARRSTAAFGQIMALMMRSPQHQRVTVGDLRGLVAPIVMSGQYALAGKRFQQGGFARPVAAVLWARVSDAVDQRLTAAAAGPLTLDRSEISSGNSIWIIDVLGDGQMIQGMIKRLAETQWKGQQIKLRTVDQDKTVSVRTIGPF